MTVRRPGATPGGHRLFKIGCAVRVAAVVASAILFWAAPFWGALYAVAMVMYAVAKRQLRVAAVVTATGMVLGIVGLVVLTALEVGTPDPMYGDYPIAWSASYTAAALGGALGSF